MAERISTALNVDHAALEATGAYDRFVDIDSLLHVDPHLLQASSAPEMVAAAGSLDKYWQDTIKVVENIIDDGDVFWREAVKRLTFKELPHAGLGYSQGGTTGAAIGKGTAEKLVETAKQIVRAGIKDPSIFELVGLLEDGVGPDLISDMTIRIIHPHLLEYTSRICAEVGAASRDFKIGGEMYKLPKNPANDSYLLLTPRDVLRDLPVAFCWASVDTVCAYNKELRERMNGLIGDNWKRTTEDNGKDRLKQVLVENPEVLADLLKQYRAKPADSYDFAEDILGETVWLEEAIEFATKYPLDLKKNKPVTPDNILDVVREICEHFRQLVENNGLSKVFWTDKRARRHERVPQLVFFAVADAYCKANGLDITPEANSGRGPVDFKFSKGYSVRVLVEVKWSNNPQLVHGFEVQLGEYAKAEKTDATIYLVIKATPSESSIDKIHELQGEAIRKKHLAPEIKVVDGQVKAPASKYKANPSKASKKK